MPAADGQWMHEPPRPKTPPLAWQIIAVVAIVLAIGATITAVVVIQKYSDERSTADEMRPAAEEAETLRAENTRRDAARTAACEFGEAVATYSHDNLDAYFDAVLERSTGEWKKNFEDSSSALRDAMQGAQASSSPGPIECGVQSLETNSAHVLLLVNQEQTNTIATEPETQQVVGLLTLEEQADGSWLVSEFDGQL